MFLLTVSPPFALSNDGIYKIPREFIPRLMPIITIIIINKKAKIKKSNIVYLKGFG